MDLYILIICFFAIALIYSSVGFAGGSSYLALMGVMSLGMYVIRPAGLICNIVVATGGTYIFYKEGLLDIRRIWPFLVSSVPFAFIGGYYPIRERTFFITLGATLIAAAFFLGIFTQFSKQVSGNPRFNTLPVNFALGAGIGLLSGLVGIGGGIFLSPILYFMRWDSARRISGLATLFILVNSISGLLGQVAGEAEFDWYFILPLVASVFVGGQIGSRWGAKKLDPQNIQRITALLIFVAGVYILSQHI